MVSTGVRSVPKPKLQYSSAPGEREPIGVGDERPSLVFVDSAKRSRQGFRVRYQLCRRELLAGFPLKNSGRFVFSMSGWSF